MSTGSLIWPKLSDNRITLLKASTLRPVLSVRWPMKTKKPHKILLMTQLHRIRNHQKAGHSLVSRDRIKKSTSLALCLKNAVPVAK
jgi:hypothetical protein